MVNPKTDHTIIIDAYLLVCLFVCLFVGPIENITVVVSVCGARHAVNILATVSTKLMRSCLDINQLGAP